MNATLCVLAGGQGQRMGRAKAELIVHGRPILQYLLEQINWRGPKMLITAPSRRSPAGHGFFDREVVDPLDSEGPMRGVLTALENLTTPRAVVTTVDMPCIKTGHINWLCERVKHDRALLGIMCRHASRVEPFPSIYRASALDVIRERFAAGQRSLAALCQHSRFVAVDSPVDWGESVWTNLNTRDDFEQFIESIPPGGPGPT